MLFLDLLLIEISSPKGREGELELVCKMKKKIKLKNHPLKLYFTSKFRLRSDYFFGTLLLEYHALA